MTLFAFTSSFADGFVIKWLVIVVFVFLKNPGEFECILIWTHLSRSLSEIRFNRSQVYFPYYYFICFPIWYLERFSLHNPHTSFVLFLYIYIPPAHKHIPPNGTSVLLYRRRCRLLASTLISGTVFHLRCTFYSVVLSSLRSSSPMSSLSSFLLSHSVIVFTLKVPLAGWTKTLLYYE